MVREAWTDERLDDLSTRMTDDFREVKEAIQSTRSELKAEIAATRNELKGEIAATRAELKGEIAATRAELKGEIAATRTELKGEINHLAGRIDRLTYTLIAALISLIATHYLG
jgi:gas vesicle protein